MAKPGAGMPPEVMAIVDKAPTTQVVVKRTVARLKLDEKAKSQISGEFDTILQAMMDDGIRVLEDFQKKAADDLVQLYVKVKEKDLPRAFEMIHKGFVSLGNQRKKRAGVHMERCVRYLLGRCGVPHEAGKAISAQSDIVVPRVELLKTYPERCVVLELKRTTRERWKQVRDEIARTGLKVWLVTLDDYLSDPLLDLMAKANITVYVPEVVYQKFRKNNPKLRSLRKLVADLMNVAKISQAAA